MTIIDTETAIIGGGPAGLQAALSLGRIHRSAVLLDSGTYRNDPAAHMHNVLGFDGTPPSVFREAGRQDIAAYETIQIREAEVIAILDHSTSPRDPTDFEVRLSTGEVVRCRSVVLATGVRDVLPEVDGRADLWGREAAQCPFCHAHEFAGQRVAVLGPAAAAHLTPILAAIASEVVVLSDGAQIAVLPENARCIATAVESVSRSDDGRVRILFGDGSEELVGGIFCKPEPAAAAPFAAALRLGLNDSGAVRVDIRGRTSRRGIYAAGDMAHHPDLPAAMPAVVNALASGTTAAATAAMDLLSGELG